MITLGVLFYILLSLWMTRGFMKETKSIIGTNIKGEPLKDALLMGFSVIPAITVIIGVLLSALWLAVQIGFHIITGILWIADNMP